MRLRARKEKLDEKPDYEIARTPVKRYTPDYKEGLSDWQVKEHEEGGWVNVTVDPPAKTTKEIIHENVFTYFNLIFVVLAVLLIIVGSFRNLTFLPVIIINTLIGIVQEIRAKRTLEKLNMLNAPKARVVRNNKISTIDSEKLVLDDIVIFKAGNQICADAVVYANPYSVDEIAMRILYFENNCVYQEYQRRSVDRYALIEKKQDEDLNNMVRLLLGAL